MNLKTKIYLIPAIALCLLSACDSKLDIVPKGRLCSTILTTLSCFSTKNSLSTHPCQRHSNDMQRIARHVYLCAETMASKTLSTMRIWPTTKA